jgi:type II secretory pathway component PulK
VAAVSLLQQQDLALRQLTTARDYEQATWVLKGGAQWARSILQQDARTSNVDHGGEILLLQQGHCGHCCEGHDEHGNEDGGATMAPG